MAGLPIFADAVDISISIGGGGLPVIFGMPDFSCAAQGAICPASSFTAIGAAFATQGYFVQSDLIWYLTMTPFGLWAPLIYIIAAMAGMISLALGVPPRMYLWFFIGPGIYAWLLDTREFVHGVEWRVADIPQDQRQVWKLAEVGLRNLNVIDRLREEGYNVDPHRFRPPDDPVEVASMFLMFDEVVSSTVQWLVRWTGVYSQKGGIGDTGIIEKPEGTKEYDRWYLLSNLKWGMLETITGARLHSAELRDAFISFLSSECGDKLAEVIDQKNFIAASNSKTGRIPCTVFKSGGSGYSSSFIGPTTGTVGSGDGAGSCIEDNPPANYSLVHQALYSTTIPVPPSTQALWKDSGKGSYACFYEGTGDCSNTYIASPAPAADFVGDGQCTGADKMRTYFEDKDNINCSDYLYFLINGFRWEAGHIYHQLVADAPEGMGDDEVLFNLFYGWDINDGRGSLIGGEQLRDWLKDLILIHLFRNEMALAPKLADRRFSGASAAQSYVDVYQANIGSKNKYGEVYTWALMIPYIQGVMLYLLAMGYPFACILIVVPGWHKALFTWMSFWAWVKLWDVGFAIVTVLERSIWAMLGNNSTASHTSPMINVMQDWGRVCVEQCNIYYNYGGDPSSVVGTFDPSYCPPVPNVSHGDGLGGGGGGGGIAGAGGSGPDWFSMLKILDRSLLLGANLDFDLANAYYIYIMAALYFAVPAATGQLVLGAKAGAAGMVSNMVGGAASESGRQAGQGFTATEAARGRANQATMGQEAYAKAMRQGGLAEQAIAAGNMGMDAGLNASAAQTAGQNQGLMGANRDRANQTYGSAVGVAGSFGRFLTSMEGGAFLEKGRQLVQQGGNRGAPSPWTAPSQNMAQYAHAHGQGGNQGSSSDTTPASVEASPGSASTGATAGATGVTPTGQTAPTPVSMLGKIWQGAKGLIGGGIRNAPAAAMQLQSAYGQFAAMQNPYVDIGTSSAGYNQTAATNQALSGYNAGQAGANVAGLGFSSAQSGFNTAQQRTGGQAEFGAQMARWNASNSFANQAAGYLGAMGMDTSFLNPGSKPTDMMGMAMSGMLGSGAKTNANYATPGSGGFWQQQASVVGQVDGKWGQSQVQGAYFHTPLPNAAVDSENSMKSMLNEYNGNINTLQSDPTKAGK